MEEASTSEGSEQELSQEGHLTVLSFTSLKTSFK